MLWLSGGVGAVALSVLAIVAEAAGPIDGLELSYILHRNLRGGEQRAMAINHQQAVTMAEFHGLKSTMNVQSNDQLIERIPFTHPHALQSQPETIFAELAQPHLLSVPDITDKNTVIALAEMSANAYSPIPHEGDWRNVSYPWHESGEFGDDDGTGFGWLDDGVRGYVFATPDNSTVVIAYKGTSGAVFDDGGGTAPNDKVNDNLLFSCCCAKTNYLSNPVCDCFDGNSCDERCVEKEFRRSDRYFGAALDVYASTVALYPNSQIWVTGHSLGGALSSFVGHTYGLPTVTFQAVPDQLPVERLHLPRPPIPKDGHIWHFGHTADPVYMGECQGPSSTCWAAGYTMETKCHSGKTCVYDVVADKGWMSSIASHRILVVIDDILKAYDEPAECKVPIPCEDCVNWSMRDGPITTRITTTSKQSTPTVTSDPSESTCVSRAWYGECLEWAEPIATVAPGFVEDFAPGFAPKLAMQT